MTLQDYFIENLRLQKEWAQDKNEKKPEQVSTRSRDKAWWRCDKGHEWQAALSSRVYDGRGCPFCANQAVLSGENDLAAVKPETAKMWHPLRNGSLSPAEVSSGSKKQVWWICDKGHEWQATVHSVSSGTACPYCSGRNAIPGETDLGTTHPELIRYWSSANKLTTLSVTAGSHKKVLWCCDKGHEWEASVASVALDGCGCPYCGGKRAIPGETDLATSNPELMAQWDKEKNTGIDPSRILPSAHDKVWWRCDKGHSWQAVVFSRTRAKASGCPYCTGKQVLAGFNDLATLRPALAEEWYQPLNGGLRPDEVSLGSNKKVWWRCGEHHVWQAAIYSRTRKAGTGCPVCAGKVKAARRTEPRVSPGRAIATPAHI